MRKRFLNPAELVGQFWWLTQVRWGHGVVTKLSVVALAAFVVLTIAVARVPSEWAIITLALVGIGALFVFLFLILQWASNNPDLAATEGATYVQSRQIGLAAKGMQSPETTLNVADPQNPTLIEADKLIDG
ncbi:MAG TPA: hypothetical protein VGA77_03890 [Propylenella sp.]